MKTGPFNKKFVVVIITLFSFFTFSTLKAQDKPNAKQTPTAAKEEKNKQRKGSITGRVMDEGGQPLLDAEVQLLPYNNLYGNPSISVVDGEGNFRFENLSASTYTVRVSAAGYVQMNEEDPIQGMPYHIDDSANIMMTKGGVITGTITNDAGEPMITVPVRAIRIRDGGNRKTSSAERNTSYATSDDRGIYRIYGLRAGTYIVYVGSSGNYFSDENNIAGHPPVFYPSSSYDTAAEVILQTGQEMSGINIRFREFAGYKISGTIANAKTFTTGIRNWVSVSLKPASGNMETNESYTQERDGKYNFLFEGISDGEYMVRAYAYLGEDLAGVYSEWQKVTIKGADVSGINLTFVKSSSLSGRVIFEEKSSDKKDEACKENRVSSFEEMILLLPRDEKTEGAKDIWSDSSTEARNTPDESGGFTAKSLRAGKRRIIIKLPGENLFVRSITGTPIAPGKLPQDIGRNGIILKPGEQAKDVKVTIAEGAARIAGKILPQQEGADIPENLLVHLLPAEKDSGDDVLRYFETTTADDGSFSVSNVLPGKYFVLVRLMKAGEEKEIYRRPVAWDDAARAKLRKDAEAANQTVELAPCKRINEFILKMK